MENCKFCGSNNVDFVKFLMSNNNITIKRQCFDCGFVGSSSYKKKDFNLNKLKFMDVEKRENYKEKRIGFLERDDYKCRCCDKKAEAVHHVNYNNVHRENEKDLISVCHSCHEKIHNNGNVFLDGVKANFGLLRYDYSTKKYTNEPQIFNYGL